MSALKFFPLIALAATTACMDGGSDAETDTDGSEILSDFAQLNATNLDIIDKVAAAGPTPTDNIPDMGEATYTGAVTFVLQDGSMDGVIGEAQVNANFGSGAVTGGADTFYDLDGNATDGSVSIEEGQIAFGSFVVGEVNGNVTFGAGAMDVSSVLSGNFSGESAELVSGVVAGTATSDASGVIPVEGAIFAEQ